jgi:hypothetical protein
MEQYASPPRVKNITLGRGLGVGLGFLPVVFYWGFSATQCPPSLGLTSCSVTAPELGGWLLDAAFLTYALEVFACVICVFMRRTRSFGMGLLTMVICGIPLSLIGYVFITLIHLNLSS